jgi:hypothetical protein
MDSHLLLLLLVHQLLVNHLVLLLHIHSVELMLELLRIHNPFCNYHQSHKRISRKQRQLIGWETLIST